MVNVKVKLLVKLKVTDSNSLRALRSAISPDNVDLPNGLELREVPTEGTNELTFLVAVERHTQILTLRNTVDEILETAEVVEKSIKSSENSRPTGPKGATMTAPGKEG